MSRCRAWCGASVFSWRCTWTTYNTQQWEKEDAGRRRKINVFQSQRKQQKTRHRRNLAPDGIVRSESDPVRDGLVLLLLHSKSSLRAESLLRGLQGKRWKKTKRVSWRRRMGHKWREKNGYYYRLLCWLDWVEKEKESWQINVSHHFGRNKCVAGPWSLLEDRNLINKLMKPS